MFEAIPPYSVRTKDGTWPFKLRVYGDGNVDAKRRFDFVAPIVNPETNRTNAFTLQAPYELSQQNIVFTNLTDVSTPQATNAGSPRRIDYDYEKNLLAVAYRAGDPTGEKCRSMINSWPVPLYKNLTWDLSFKLGGDLPGEEWPLTRHSVSPKLLWQIKTDNKESPDPSYPSMGFWVDTDPDNKELVRLTFFRRKFATATIAESERWHIGGLKRGEFIDVVVQVGLNDRDDGPTNTGILKVWVNGKLIVYQIGRNLIQQTITTANKDIISSLPRFALGVYLMAENEPVQQTFITQWRSARMLVAD